MILTVAVAVALGASLGQPAPPVDRTVYVVLFDSPGCPGCEEGLKLARETLEGLPGVELVTLNAKDRETFLVYEVLAERAGLGAEQMIVSPSLFVDTDWIDLRNAGAGDIRRAANRYRGVGTGRYWEVSEREKQSTTSVLLERFQRFGLATVLVAGLLDGVNPCAFATIIFLLSYLAHLGRGRREVLYAGVCFAAGIFVPYFLLGAGLLSLSDLMRDLPAVRRGVTEALAFLALIFALLSFADYSHAKAGRTEKMVLKLPRVLQRRIHGTVRESARAGVLLGAMGAGAIVAVLEAACTGQIYLPTIAFVAGVSTLRSKALTYLALYNLAFLAPLVGIVVATYFGLSSRAAAAYAERQVPQVKLLIGLLFLLLAAGLHFSVA